MSYVFHSAIMGMAIFFATCVLANPDQSSPMTTKTFEFVSNGYRLSGFVDIPSGGIAQAMIVIIPGYGKTDVAGQSSYYDLRSLFTSIGISTLIWDKPGCGKSEGTFSADQPVNSSAQEVLDAIHQAIVRKLPGSQRIGLWGISRAGWIAPLAITQEPSIAFWISVSGTDDKENFPYMLEANLRIEGRTEEQITRLLGEWKHGFEIMSHGGTYESYLAATKTLRHDPFIMYLSGDRNEDKAAFLAEQRPFLSGAFKIDKTTGLMIYVPHFQRILSNVNIPVLALFGEKDRNVDWHKTMALYRRTIGNNPQASLTIHTFLDGNHNLQQATTGSLREMVEMKEHVASAGYHETMREWLRTTILN